MPTLCSSFAGPRFQKMNTCARGSKSPSRGAAPAGWSMLWAMGSQWRLFWALMGYGLLVSVLVPALAWLFVGMGSPVSFLIASALVGLLLYGFVNYVIVKFTLRNLLVRFLEKFNPLVERPLPKPENPLKST